MSIHATTTRIRNTLLTALLVALMVASAASAATSKNAPGYRFITDTLGGNGGVAASAKPLPDAVDRWVATHRVSPANGLQGYRFITDTLGGNGGVAASAKPLPDAVDRWVATHSVSPANGVQGYRFITDTLGGSGHVAASAPVAGGTGLDWGAVGMGVGLGLLLSALLVGALKVGRARRLAHL
jgi:hypothetical protein